MSHLLNAPPRRAIRLWPMASAAVVLAFSVSVLGAQAAPSELLGAHRQLLSTASNADAALRIARARLAAAKAASAAAAPTPVTTLGAEFADGLGGNIATGNLTVTASREIHSGARRAAARDVAAVDVATAMSEVAAHERALSLEITRDLAAAVGATRILARIDAGDVWLADAESALTTRFSNGDARYLDVLRVRTERLQLAADRADAVADRRAAIAALRTRVGDAMTATTLAALVDRAAADAEPESWRALLGSRPANDSLLGWSDALRAARADEARSEAQRRLLVAEQRRQWNGVAGVQRIGPDNGGNSLGIVLGLSTTLPFTARRGFAALQQSADTNVMAAAVTSAAVQQHVASQLDAALARDEAAQERLRLFNGALGGATSGERDAALAHYRNGEITLLELLDFERALLRVEVERARAITAAAAARAALFGLDS